MPWEIYRRSLFFALCLFPAVVPLLHSDELSLPSVLPKAVVVKIGAAVVLALWLLGLALNKKWALLKRSPLFSVIVCLLTITVAVSTALSTDPWMSFYGVYERQIGLLGFFAPMALGLALSTVVNDRREVGWFLTAIIAGGILVSCHGLIEYFGSSPEGARQVRPQLKGLLGNSNFTGNYLALTSALTLGMCVVHLKSFSLSIPLAIAFLPQVAAVFFTSTRGSYVALMAAVLAVLLFTFSTNLRRGERRYSVAVLRMVIFLTGLIGMGFVVVRPDDLLGCGIFLLLNALIFLVFHFITRKLEIGSPRRMKVFLLSCFVATHLVNLGLYNTRNYFEASDPAQLRSSTALRALDNYYSIFTLSDEATPRFQLWRESLRFIPEHPWFGIGLETYRREFMSRKSAYLESLEPHTNYDNPHNLFLYYLATLGAVGALPYLTLHLLLAAAFIYLMFFSPPRPGRHGLVFCSFLGCYWMAGIPGFDVMSTMLLFWLMTGLLAAYLHLEAVERPESRLASFVESLGKRPSLGKGVQIATAVTAVAICGTLLYHAPTVYDYLKADRHMRQAFAWANKGRLPYAIPEAEKARALNPNEHAYVVKTAALLQAVAKSQKTREAKLHYIKKAEDVLEEGLTHSWAPENIYIREINGRMIVRDLRAIRDACNMALKYSPHLEVVKKKRDEVTRILEKAER